ncbi:MAG: hypothetical protein V4726_07465 [Verrucomicrobiota bacterium]
MSPRFRHLGPLPGLLLLTLAACLGAVTSHAAPAPTPDARELWVPRKNLAEALKSSSRSIVLTAEQFASLLRDSLPRPASETVAPPVPAVLTEARYEGTPGERFVTFHAEFTVECLTPDWTQVPLALHPRWLGAVRLDGESALQPSGDPADAASRTVILVRGAGRHSLSVDFALPVEDSAGRRGFTLPSPGAAGARLTLAVPDSLKLESSAPFTRQEGGAVFALPAGPEEVRVAWSARDLAPLETGAVFQECRMRYTLDPARLSAGLDLTWHSPLRPLPVRLTLPLPADTAVLGADGPDLLRWTLADGGLVLDFAPGDRKTAALRLSLERTLTLPDQAAALKLALPAPVAEGVFRASGQFSITASGDLRVRGVNAGPLAERDDSRAPADAGGNVFGTWIFPVLPHPPEVELQPLRVQFAATLDTQITLTREAVRLKRWLTLTPRDGTLFSPRLENLGAGEEIESVLTADGKEMPWKKTEAGLTFPGNEGLAAGKPWTVVVESRLDPPGWQNMTEQALTLSLTSAKVPGAGKVNGYVALSFDESRQVVSQPVSGLEPRDPAQFAGTLPLTGQLAWSRLDDFQLNLAVSRRVPEYDAAVVLYALPLLNGLEVEGALTLSIDRSPLREIRVAFPAAAAPSVRWDSPLLAESFLEPDNIWRLRFHQETDGRPSLRFRLSMPLTDATETAASPAAPASGAPPQAAGGISTPGGSAAAPERRFTVEAPVLAVPGARRLSGTMIVEANTDTELTFTASGLNPLDTLRVPPLAGYQPSHRLVSAWTWPGGNPALTIHGVRHRPGSLVSTVVDRLVLDTVVSAEGPVRHQARLEVRTAGDQYLDVVLPPEARVLTLLVNDAVTKPVRNRQGGLRVPLPGPVAVIRLICECPGAALAPSSSSATARLTPVTPDPALPVLDTQWRLHLPDGFSYSGFDSNLTETKQQQASAEAPAVLALVAEEGRFLGGAYDRILPSVRAKARKEQTVADVRERNGRALSILQVNLAAQQDGVNTAREEALRLMKLHGIVDMSLAGAGGGPTPFVGTSNNLYFQSKEKEQEMRIQADKFKANLESLSKLSGDQLIEGTMVYGVEDDTIRQFASGWKKDKAEYERLTASGFSRNHPKALALAESIGKQEKILRDAAENYKTTLSINIQNIETALASTREVTARPKTENLNEKMNSAEYAAARQAWEQKLELLNRLRETILKTASHQDSLKEIPGDEPYPPSVVLDVLPGTVDNLERNSPADPEDEVPDSPEKAGLETRTFRVPENFLALLAESGTSSIANATAADPFAVGTNEGAVAAFAVKPTAGSALSALGLKFENGATATFSAGTGTLVIRNTPDQLAAAAVLLRGLAAAGNNTVGGLVSASDREGILPLDFALPEGGRVYRFDGQYPPGTLTFRYESWRNQVRWSWLWIALGILGFRLLGGWRSPWFTGIVGALVLQIGPGVLGRGDWLPVTNALLIGWLLAAVVRVIFGKMLRPRRQSQAGGTTPVAGVFPSPQVLSALLIGSVLFSGSLFCPNAVRAQEPPAPAPAPAPLAVAPLAAESDPAVPEPPTVIVPFDPDKPPEGQSPERRYLDYATFQRMWTAAKANRAREAAKLAAAPATGERAATLTSALHRAEADGRVLRVESVYVLLTRGPDWTGVPFALESGLKNLSLDGAPAALKDGQLLVEKAGTHQITASYEVPLPPGWQEVTWQVPAATASSLALSLAMDDPARPVVNDGSPVVETETNGRRVFTAPLGAVSAISLKRRTVARRAGAQAAEPSLAKVTARVFLSPALERVEASVDYTFAGQERAEFSLSLDPGLTPVSFSVPGLENWTLRREAGAQVLDFRLERPARDAFSVNLVAERPVGALPLTESAPLISAAASRVEREWSVLATNDVEVRPLPADGLHRVDFEKGQGAGQAGFDAVGAWRAAGHAEALLRWELRPQAPEASAVVRYALQPGADKLELSAGLELHPAADRELRDLTIQVPEGSTVQGVSGDRLADWWHEGTALHVRFERSLTDDNITRLALNLTRPLAAGAADFSFSPLVIGGFSKVSGSGLLLAPVNQETTLVLAPAAPGLREVAPEETATGFTIRPPFESKRGFVFSGPGWTATASLKPLTARYDIDWVMDAEVRDSWVELNTRVLLALTRGGVESVEFTTPAGAPEFRVTGEGLRGTVSAVEGNVRRYTVSFQSLRTGTALFTLTGQMPLGTMAADGGPGLPDIDFAGAARVSRFVIVDNKSAGDMKLRPSGMDITPREQVSLLPAELVSGRTAAQFYRARPGWSMRVAVEKLETSAGQAAVVLQADLTTSLLRNGDVWQRAVYVLANRSLQFLPVHLPEGAEVISVIVGDEATRADSGVVDGLPVLLVPLIQTAPGELAMEVKLIYRLRGRAAPAGGFPEGLDDPELPGISVGQTFWTVQYPDGFTLEPEGGNMTRVEDGALSGEKAVSRLTEIGSLRSIAESENYDRATRARARGNVRKLEAAWRELLPTGRGEDYPQILKDSERGPFPAEESPLPEPAVAGPEAEAYRAKEFVFNKTADGTAAAASTATPPAEAAAAGQAGEKLSLNDHVSWAFESRDKVPEKTPPARNYRRVNQISRFQETGNDDALKPATGGRSAAADATKDSAFLSGSLEMNHPADNTPRDRHRLEQRKRQDFDTQNRSYSFGNARLNNSAQAVAGTRPQDGPAAGAEAKKSAPAPPPGQPQSPAPVNGASGSAVVREDVKNAQSGDDGRDKDDGRSMDGVTDAGQTRLRTTGRVSLDAVFPAQAREMHFRKMKGGATLRVRVTDKTSGRGVNWGGVVALTAGLAVLFGFRTLHRRTR